MSIEYLLSGILLEKSTLLFHKTDNKKFTLFSFILSKTHEGQQYTWKINKSYDEFRKLQKKLKKDPLQPIPKILFPGRWQFYKQSWDQELGLLSEYLKVIMTIFITSNDLAEFLEVSIMSFSSKNKLKEGYVYKYGGGRLNNQKRCFNCCTKIVGKKKRWARMMPNGIEFRASNTSSQLEEVINYCKDFKIKSGNKETGFKDGILITTSQHKFLFRTEKISKRDEWIESLTIGFSKSEFYLFKVRYNSSFITRMGNNAKWYIDGKDYYNDVYEHLSKAKNSVCISDWWLSPDMYLQRPVSSHSDSKIIDLLGTLADRDVSVYVLLYKEITFTLTMNSLYTKKALKQRNEKIKVLRHPTFSIRGGEFLWSHHTKLICVDNNIAFLGGLDLCFGRWDTSDHLLEDVDGYIWPGIDYSNVRVSDFVKVHKYERDSIDRTLIPRMPWHDVCVSVSGIIVKDLWNHFLEVWNHVIKDITGSQNRQDMMALRDSDIFKSQDGDSVANHQPIQTFEPKFSILVEKETSDKQEDFNEIRDRFIQNRAVSKIEEIKPIASKFSFLDLMKNLIQKTILDPFPNIPKESIDIDVNEVENRKKAEAMDDLETIKSLKTPSNFFANIHKKVSKEFSFEQEGTVECQVLRSAGSWSVGREIPENSIHSAYIQLILEAKFFIYIENQFFISRSAGDPVINEISEALIKRIEIAIELKEDFRVIVVLPLLPAFEGSVDDPSAAVLRVQLHWEYKTICREKGSIYSRLRKYTDTPEKYIGFYSLRTHGIIAGIPVSEMIYVHSKLLIVDDSTVVIGSANINDRSMNGDRDAELCIVINDSEKVTVEINETVFEVSRFAQSFRIALFKEHAGCQDDQTLENPFSPEFRKVWDKRAKRNTRYYRNIFRCYPDDRITNLSMIKEYSQMADLSLYEKYSKRIKGHIVQFPLNFLCEEDLKISVTQKEYLLPDSTFI